MKLFLRIFVVCIIFFFFFILTIYKSLSNFPFFNCAGSNYENLLSLQRSHGRKICHEEVALQWVVSNGNGREKALANSWCVFKVLFLGFS